MTKYHFTLKEVFTFGWNKTVQHAWFSFLTLVIITIILNATVLNPLTWISPFHQLINIAVVLMIALSLVSISLMIARNHSFTFADLWYPVLSPRRVLKFVAMAAIMALPVLISTLAALFMLASSLTQSSAAVLLGMAVFLVALIPSAYVLVRLKFFPFVVVEHEHASVKDLILMSYKLTENNFWLVFFYVVCILVLNCIGALLFCVGLLVTVPVSLFAGAHLYDRVKGHAHN
jgi:hypothetical protein